MTLQPTNGKPFMGVTITKSGRPAATPLGALNGRYYDAIVSFRTPFAVRNALSDYSIEATSHCVPGTTGDSLERNVRAGEVVHVRLEDVFAVACGRSVTIEVLYRRPAEMRRGQSRPESEVIVGEATVTGP